MTYAEYLAAEGMSEQIPSLQEYVLLSQSEPLVEVYRRGQGGSWELREARAGAKAHLASLGNELDVSALYEDPLAAS